ncbi:MAG: hypothetical protein AAF658_04425, partial [Myxococcota bacterium]
MLKRITPWMLGAALIGLVAFGVWKRLSSTRSVDVDPSPVAEAPAPLPEHEPPPNAKPPEVPAQPDWAVVYGQEFWREASDGEQKSEVAADSDATELNVGDVMERTGNAFQMREGDTALTARSYTHRTILTEKGIRFHPYDPAREQAEAIATADQDTDAFGHAQDLRQRAHFNADVSVDWDLGGIQLGDKRSEDIGEWRAFGNTAQRRVRVGDTEVVEHIQARDAGVERTWVVPERPTLAGDLTIDTEVSGLDILPSEDRSSHFADTRGVSRAAIGPPVLVDASGKRTPLSAALTSSGLRYTVTENQWKDAEFPIAIDPTVGSEFGVNNPVAVSAFSTQDYPDSQRKYQGGNVMVWEDSRSGAKVFAARLDEYLNLIDTTGIEIGSGYKPRVDCDRNSRACYVVYYRYVSSRYRIYGRTFDSTSGYVGSEYQISSSSYHAYNPDVALAGNGWVVGWHAYISSSSGYDIRARRVNDSRLTSSYGSTPIYTVAGGGGTQSTIRLSGRNGSYVVGAYIDSGYQGEGIVLNTYGRPISGQYPVEYSTTWQQHAPNVALSNYNRALFVFKELTGTTRYLRCRTYQVNYYPASPFGGESASLSSARNCNGSLEYGGGSTSDLGNPTVTARTGNNSGWLVGWMRKSNSTRYIRTRYVSNSATLGTLYTPHTISNTSVFPATTVACGNSYCYVAWHQSGASGYDIYAHRTGSTGSPYGSEKVVSLGYANQGRPRIALNANYGLITWIDYRSGDDELYAAGVRVNSSGPYMYSSGFLVDSSSSIYSHDVVDVGSSYFPIVYGV